jgi:uncharacterized protein
VKFENHFTVEAPPASVWGALMDFERVVPCMPGAEVLERKGESAYQVQVRVKVGPMSMVYRGAVEITGRDEGALTAEMHAQARETRGQGTANATVQIKLAAQGSGTEAAMATDLRLSGRAAAMGRGVIADVSQALISDFAGNLARLLSEAPGSQPETAGSAAAGAQQPSQVARPAPPAEELLSPGPVPAQPALDAGRLARNMIAARLRDPRTAISALLGAAFFASGFLLGRSRNRTG